LSEDLLGEPFTVHVLDRPDAWELSGHCPIVIEFPNL
jgi:hypothetical protein